MRRLKVNDFFCGCGGLGLAFQEAGYEIVGAWDFDKFAVETYRENVGDHVQKADIKELHQADIPQADVWAFGFPCQDLSVAGKQKGMILKCQDCGEVVEINPEEYTGENACPKCGGKDLRAESRSGCFFEIMRLLEETELEREKAILALKAKYGEGVEIIDSFVKDFPKDANAAWFLGKSIELLSLADGALFLGNWYEARGCKIERHVCHEYGIEIVKL